MSATPTPADAKKTFDSLPDLLRSLGPIGEPYAKAVGEHAARIEPALGLLVRLQSYFGNGGLFNPEMMEHDKVRTLLSDLQDELRRWCDISAAIPVSSTPPADAGPTEGESAYLVSIGLHNRRHEEQMHALRGLRSHVASCLAEKDRRIDELEQAVSDLNSYDAPKEVLDLRARLAEKEAELKVVSTHRQTCLEHLEALNACLASLEAERNQLIETVRLKQATTNHLLDEAAKDFTLRAELAALQADNERLRQVIREDIISARIIRAENEQRGRIHAITRDSNFIEKRCNVALASPLPSPSAGAEKQE